MSRWSGAFTSSTHTRSARFRVSRKLRCKSSFGSEKVVTNLAAPVLGVLGLVNEALISRREVQVRIFSRFDVLVVGLVVFFGCSVRRVGWFSLVKCVAWSQVLVTRRYPT